MTQQVIIVFGVEIRDYSWTKDVKPFVAQYCDVKAGSSDTFTYPKNATSSAVAYEIHIKFEFADFAAALDTADAIVMYNGHSRYGQGPSCGPANTPTLPDKKNYPVNPWGVHYRMGYDAVKAHCLEDIMHHSILPTEYDLPNGKSTFLPRALVKAAENANNVPPGADCLTSGAWRAFDSCQGGLAKKTTSRGDTPLQGRHYYAAIHGTGPSRWDVIDGPKDEFLSAVSVGSTDLDKTKLKCKLLIMAACSSRVHFLDALARQRDAEQSKCKFILANFLAWEVFPLVFLRQVLLRGLDPTTLDGMKTLVKKFNAEDGSGYVGLY